MIVRIARVKVGHRQTPLKNPSSTMSWGFCFGRKHKWIKANRKANVCVRPAHILKAKQTESDQSLIGSSSSMREFGRVGSFLRVSAAPCAERAKSDRVHVSTKFDVDTIFLPWLSRLNVGGLDAYLAIIERTFYYCRDYLSGDRHACAHASESDFPGLPSSAVLHDGHSVALCVGLNPVHNIRG